MEHAFIVQLSLDMTTLARLSNLSEWKQRFNFTVITHPCKLSALACSMIHRILSEKMMYIDTTETTTVKLNKNNNEHRKPRTQMLKAEDKASRAMAAEI